jgi:hypothetical protein
MQRPSSKPKARAFRSSKPIQLTLIATEKEGIAQKWAIPSFFDWALPWLVMPRLPEANAN